MQRVLFYQQNDAWTDRITLLLLVCEVHSLPGTFITPLPSWRREKGTVGGKKKMEGRRGGMKSREEDVWGASSQAE